MRRSTASLSICAENWPTQINRPSKAASKTYADFVLGEPNAAVYVSGIANKVADGGCRKKFRFDLEIVQPKVPLVRSGTMNLKVVVHRDEGFDAPIYVQFPFTPPGVGAAGAITIDKGQNEGLYPLNANGDAMIGKWPVMVIGAAEIDGQAWVSSQLAELEIADRYVSFDVKRAACDQGQAGASPMHDHSQHAIRRHREGRAARVAAGRDGRSGGIHARTRRSSLSK